MEPSDVGAEVTLNKRGMPARKRRRNSFYFNDDNVNSGGDTQKQSGSKGKLKSVKQERKDLENSDNQIKKKIVHNSVGSLQSQDYVKGQGKQRFYPHPGLLKQSAPVYDIMEKSSAHKLSLRIRNMMRHMKAHKWVCYEFFYSDIDRVLFLGENDFQMKLKDAFPGLKTRKLNRNVWCKIRQMMGKPRRCSQAFFDEEREVLARKRQKIRMIQQRRDTNFDQRELPDEIPLMLTIGTKVTARIRSPQDGIFSGTVGGVDTSNSSYRITFDRAFIGTHSVPDYEVIATQPPEMVKTYNYVVPRGIYGNLNDRCKFQNSLLLREGVFPGASQSDFSFNVMLGGFPKQFLIMIVQFSRMLKVKREKLFMLKELNSEAEKFLSYSKPYPKDFRIKYSRSVLELETLNKQMDICSSGIQQFCIEMQTGNKTTSSSTLIPEDFRNHCQKETQALVMSFNNSDNGNNKVQNPNTLSLIAKLGSLLLQTQVLSLEDRTPLEIKSVKDTVADIKASLLGSNVQYFQNNIEIPMNRIQAGLSVPSSKLT